MRRANSKSRSTTYDSNRHVKEVDRLSVTKSVFAGKGARVHLGNSRKSFNILYVPCIRVCVCVCVCVWAHASTHACLYVKKLYVAEYNDVLRRSL
jgi:hypothetical protein